MKFTIHRGTNEIGGSCVEVWTDNSRIVIDFGMPLVDTETKKKDFDYNEYKLLSSKELMKKGVLPNIKDLYEQEEGEVDGVLISHAHQDHFGFIDHIDKDVQFYLGKATHKIIELNNVFTHQNIVIEKQNYFESGVEFTIGEFSVTPYLTDHSAFDAYSFLIKAEGKSLFYSGDFRAHGRKQKLFYWFMHNAPQNVDYLLLEGTSLSREVSKFKSEETIETELFNLFQQPKINLIYCSGQNIDRLVSIYKACKKSGKTLVVDVYVANVLKTLSEFAALPYPSKSFKDIKVVFTKKMYRIMKQKGNEKLFFQFKNSKITREEINEKPENIVMVVRPSLKGFLSKINNPGGGNIIYSLWGGYLKKEYTKEFINFLTKKSYKLHHIHTSGHADIDTLKKMVSAVKPKYIIPIHTFEKNKYKDIFDAKVIKLNDGEVRDV